jgi:hypothetical protein
MNAEDRNDIRLLRNDVFTKIDDVEKKIDILSAKLDASKEAIALFKIEEAKEGASHMTRDECQEQEAAQNQSIDDLKKTINRASGAVALMVALPTFLGAIYAIIQIFKSLASLFK